MDHAITDGATTAVINAHGAELTSLRDAAGTEYIWQAGPAWPRHAPVLFPIVGRLAGDQLRHGDRAYRLTQHGFARDRAFAFLDRAADPAVLSSSTIPKRARSTLLPSASRFPMRWPTANLPRHSPSSTPAPNHCRSLSARIPPSTGRLSRERRGKPMR